MASFIKPSFRGFSILFMLLLPGLFPVAIQAQVNTPFDEANPLFAPPEREGFTFAILGDRTGGTDSGLTILEQAVAELNFLDPDLVMTVGDLIDGYNKPHQWKAQMERYKQIMSVLKMPWYPTAGNHDVYGDGGSSKDTRNESLYLEHFGPLYYSFDYKNAHFIVLYSDEHLSYRNPPKDQQMSREQLDWLIQDLEETDAKHTFVFLHHPRWNYEGDVWKPVHDVLVQSGKVSAVIAGHWHRYRSDGERDGIRYYCLATTGAHQDKGYENAGLLHHYNLVTVRDDSWSMAVLPVGSVLDPDFVSGEESDDVYKIRRQGFVRRITPFPAPVDGPLESEVNITIHNPATKRLDIAYRLIGIPEEGWGVDLPKGSVRLDGGGEAELCFRVKGSPVEAHEILPLMRFEIEVDYALKKGGKQLITSVFNIPYDVPELPEALTKDESAPAENRTLKIDGVDGCAIIEASDSLNMTGPFTLECWAKLDKPGERAALLAKTQNSAYGLWIAEGDHRGPAFMIYFENHGYVKAEADEEHLHESAWAHYAGVFDGTTLRLYVNGRCLSETTPEAPLKIRNNDLPLIVGADVNGGGNPCQFSVGLVDEVRLSNCARYSQDFEPEKRFAKDEETLVLLHFDRLFCNRTPDVSGKGNHGRLQGGSRLKKE